MKKETFFTICSIFMIVTCLGRLSIESYAKDERGDNLAVCKTSDKKVANGNKANSAADDDSSDNDPRDNFDYASLFDSPDKLLKLDKTAPIWASRDRKNVLLGGVICLREGLLEFFACRKNSKEHESIVALDIPPHLIHASLLAIGAKQGAPAKYDPEFTPPSGEKIEIEVRWFDEKTKELKKARAQEFVLENESGKTMRVSWVFTGGLFGVDPDGKKYYLANVTGEIFGVSNFPGSVLDVPLESSNDNSELCYTPNTEAIPPIGTNVLLVLSKKDAR